MATVEAYSLANGQRRYRVRYRTPDRRGTDKKGFHTKREAQAFAATIEVSMMRGEYVAPSAGRITVAELADRYLSLAHVKATTAVARQSAWDHRVGPRWGDVWVGDVRPSAIKSWVTELAAGGTGPASIEAALLVLRGILSSAVDDRQLAVNPAINIKTPRRQHVSRGYLSHRQVAALAAQLNRADAVLVNFLAYSGLRFGEAAALRVESFDILRRRLNVTEAVAEVRGALVTSTPKSHERRSVPFPGFLAEELATLMIGKSRDALVFTSQTGLQLRVSRFRSKTFAPAVARCIESDPAFPVITPHDLRHTAASLAISTGANPKSVQTMLGHRSAAMTLDTYADLFPDDLDAVAARLNEARARNVGAGRREATRIIVRMASDLQ